MSDQTKLDECANCDGGLDEMPHNPPCPLAPEPLPAQPRVPGEPIQRLLDELIRRASEGCEGPVADYTCTQTETDLPLSMWCDPCRCQEAAKAIQDAAARPPASPAWQDSRGYTLPAFVAVVRRYEADDFSEGVVLEGHTSLQDWELTLDAAGNCEDFSITPKKQALPAAPPETNQP